MRELGRLLRARPDPNPWESSSKPDSLTHSPTPHPAHQLHVKNIVSPKPNYFFPPAHDHTGSGEPPWSPVPALTPAVCSHCYSPGSYGLRIMAPLCPGLCPHPSSHQALCTGPSLTSLTTSHLFLTPDPQHPACAHLRAFESPLLPECPSPR